MNHIGLEQTLVIDGTAYRLSRFTRRVARLFFDWADGELPRLLDVVSRWLSVFPEDTQKHMVKVALLDAKNRLSFHNPELTALMGSPRGLTKCVALMLGKYQPALSEADALELAEEARREHGDSELERLFVAASGRMMPDETELEVSYFREIGILPSTVLEEHKAGSPEDWEKIDAHLLQEYHLKPWEVDELTLSEIFLYLRSSEKEGVSFEAGLAHAKLFHKLTPRQQLELGLRQYS